MGLTRDISLPRGDVGLIIADVSDKGIPAALYMVFARTLLRAAAIGGGSPATMLERANELMLADSASDMFVTAYYSILDPAVHSLTLASAGHNLAVFAPAGEGDPVPLMTPGIPLGILTPARIEERVVMLSPGDVVVFYTDGVSEALSPEGGTFGEERLHELVRESRSLAASEIASVVAEAVQAFIGDETRSDDITLIVLKRSSDAESPGPSDAG